MQEATEAFKQAFLKQMLLGLHVSGMNWPARGMMSVQQRTSAVKLSADAAMAVARGSRRWTRGLIAVLAREERNGALLRAVLGDQYERLTRLPNLARSFSISRSKKIVRRSIGRLCAKRKWPPVSDSKRARVVARSLMEKRTQVLRGLVPGAATLECSSLLDEALDYVVSLRAQVDLMQKLVSTIATAKLIRSQKNERKLAEGEARYDVAK